MVLDPGDRGLFGLEPAGELGLGQSGRFPCLAEDDPDFELLVALIVALGEFPVAFFL